MAAVRASFLVTRSPSANARAAFDADAGSTIDAANQAEILALASHPTEPMEPLLLAAAGLVVFVITAVGLSIFHERRRSRKLAPGRRRRRGDSAIDAIRAEAEAEIEEHDIDDMHDAIAARRRAHGRADIGQELARELLGDE